MGLLVLIVIVVVVVGSIGGHHGRKYHRRRRAGLTVRESVPFGRHGRISISERFGGDQDRY